MRLWLIAISMLLLLSIAGECVANTWQSDSGIVSGLGDVGLYSAPCVFQKDSIWYLIAGEEGGGFYGFNWTGSSWQSDSGIVSGLGSVGEMSAPCVFQKDTTWYLISGEYEGVFCGFNWTGSSWQSDSGIVSGLGRVGGGEVGGGSAPCVFQKDTTWYLISGEYEGGFYGFNWTGSSWQSDSGIVSGLGGVGWISAPCVFQKDTTWYLIAGEYDGVFNGYNWTGSSWQSDSDIVSGLGGVGLASVPTVFQKDTTWYLIAGEKEGAFYGFNLMTSSPTGLSHTKGVFWVNHTWSVGTGHVTDSYNVSINGTWYNGTTNTYYNNTLTTYGDWSNITVYAYNDTYGLSAGYVSEDVQLPYPVPAVPTGASSTWDYYWVNHTWTEGSSYGIWCGDTDSYNVSINGTWHNSTTNTYYNNTGLSSHGWSNASIYAFNNTAGINETHIYTSDWSGWEGENVYVDYDASDLDSDTPTFSCNRTDLFADFDTANGTGNWTTAANGTFKINFGVSDGWGSTNNYTMTVVSIVTTPATPTNLAYNTGCHWVNHTWVAGIGTATDSYNVSVNGVWYNTTTDTFYNESDMSPIGWSNISVYAFNNSQGTISNTNVYQNVQIPRCPSLCPFTFYDPFHYYGVHNSKVAGEGGWLPCDDNVYVHSDYGINFYSTSEGDNIVYGTWDPLVEDYTSCYHGIDATGDCEIIYLHADIRITTTHNSARVYVGEPFYDADNPTNPTHELIGFRFYIYSDDIIIHLLGTPGTYPDVIVMARPGDWISVSVAYDLTTKEYIYLEAIDSETTHTLYDISTTYTTQTRELSNVTLRFGTDSGSMSFGGRCYVDNVYVSSLEYNSTPTYVILTDASGNQIMNTQVAIYDKSLDAYTQKWENNEDGIIRISSGASGEPQVSVRTFDGIYTRQFQTDESGGIVNWTIPLNYNLKVYPEDQSGVPLTGVFAGLSEYTPHDPLSFWGFSMSGSKYVPVMNTSGFLMCDIYAEKGGYEDYSETALNWTSKSALVKDYRHTITLTKE